MRPLLGIVSWLPPDEPRRSVRKGRAADTFRKCREWLPSVPVLVLAQGWQPMELAGMPSGITFSLYPRLGILGARRELRERFLQSPFDCLIMLDDDSMLSGSKEDSDLYLAELQAHPGCFGERNGTSLKMFSVCREVFVPYPDVDPERGQGYEDRAFVEALRREFPDRRFSYSHGPVANDDASSDPHSTWERNGPNPMRIGQNGE